MSFQAGSTAGVPAVQVKNVVFNTSQNAGTYTLATANGDVWVEVIGSYVKTAGAGFTTVALTTNHTTPKSIVAAITAAAATLDLNLTIVVASFFLPSTKLIQGVIVGTGSGGEIDTYVRWTPLSNGASLV